MAVTLNAKGTSVSSFTIGKGGQAITLNANGYLTIDDGVDTEQPLGYNTIPIYEIDAADTFDLAHAGMMWHKDAGGAVTFTCDNDSTIPQGSTWIVHNDDAEDITIAEGTGVTIAFLASGAAPATGDVTVSQGGVVTVYKYTDTEYWVWGDDGPFNILTAGSTTDATLRWNGSAWAENTTVTITSTGVVTAASTAGNHTFSVDSATTNADIPVVKLSASSTGTPAAGIGPSIQFEAETAAANLEIGGEIALEATDVTATTEDFDFVFNTMAAGAAAAERFRISSTGSSFATDLSLTGTTHLVLPLTNDAVTPTLAFGDGDTGFYEETDDTIAISVAGTRRFLYNSTAYASVTTDGFYLDATASTSANPAFAFQGDTDTGLGKAAADQASIIAGGVELIRATETGTATTDQVTIAPGVTLRGAAATPALAFGDGDTGFYESADDTLKFTAAGADAGTLTTSLTWNGTIQTSIGGRMVNEAASATNPNYVPTAADLDTGIGSAAADQLSLISGGVEMVRLVEDTEDYILSNTPILIAESANAVADTAAYGQVWVKNDAPNTLMFTDDTGVDQVVITSDSIVGDLKNCASGTATLSTTADDYVELFSVSRSNGAHSFVLHTVMSDSGFSVAKTYLVTAGYSGTGGTAVYEVMIPDSDSGVYSGNDYRVEIDVTTTTATVRAVRTSGANGSTLDWEIWAADDANAALTITPLSGTGTSAVTAIYNPHRIADIKGTDYVDLTHDGTDLNVTATNTAEFTFGSALTRVNLIDGVDLRLTENGTADYVEFQVGAGLNVVGSGTPTINFSNFTDYVWFRDGANLRISDAGDTNYIELSHSGTTFDLAATAGTTNQFWVRDGIALRISDAGDTDYGEFSHDGTDFNTTFTNTVDWNISGLSNQVNILDAELTVEETGGGQSTLRLGGPTVRTSNSSDGRIIMFGENSSTKYGAEITIPAGYINFLGSTEGGATAITGARFNLSAVDIYTGGVFRVRDSSGVDHIAISHDGTDANIVGTTTTDLNITSGFTAVNLPEITLTTALDETYGGTGQTTLTTGDLLYASGANTFSKLALGNVGEVLTVVGSNVAWNPPAVIEFAYDSTVTAADPGAGTIRFDSVTIGSIANAYIDDLDASGDNAEWILSNLADGDILTFRSITDPLDYIIASVNGSTTDGTGYWTVPLTLIHTGTIFTNGDQMRVSVEWAGSNASVSGFISGTVANNQIVTGTGASTVDSSANLTYDGTTLTMAGAGAQLLLPIENDAVTPTLGFGDGDTGFYENSDDVFRLAIAGSALYQFDSTHITGTTSASFYLRNTTVSAVNPSLGPRRDTNTGIGSAENDSMSLIAGGVEMMRFDSTVGGQDHIKTEVPFYMDERAAALNDYANYGQLWVRTETPNMLMFTDDAGNDFTANNVFEIAYAYSSAVTSTDPGAGTLNFNSVTIGSITTVYIDDLDDTGRDNSYMLSTLADGDLIEFRSASDPADYIVATVNGAPTDSTGFWTISLTLVNTGTIFTNGDQLRIIPTFLSQAPGGGTVTSVDITAGTLIDKTGGPITTSGSITIDVDLSEATEAVYAPATDYLLFLDGGVTGTAAKESGADFAAALAGTGLTASGGVINRDTIALTTDTSGDYVATITGGTGIDSTGATTGEGIAHTLSVDLGEVTAVVFDPAVDFVPIIDGGATGTTQKDAWADIATAIAGTGITATAGVLSADNNGTVTSVDITAGTLIDKTGGPITTSGSITIDVDLSEATEAVYAPATDYLLFLDGGVTGTAAKESGVDFAAALAGAGLTASSGTLTADVPSTITVADESADTTCFPLFVTAATGDLQPKTGTNITFNSATGHFTATSKSFLIKHPTKPGKKLQYGSLEGPEHGVYVRGRLTDSDTIELPDYWTALIDPNSITVNLTPIGAHQELYVADISDNKVIVGGSTDHMDFFYTVYAERVDVDRIELEIDDEDV